MTGESLKACKTLTISKKKKKIYLKQSPFLLLFDIHDFSDYQKNQIFNHSSKTSKNQQKQNETQP